VANIFEVQGFGALSEWNGQFSSASADQAFHTIAALGSNSIELTARIWTQSGTTDTVIADPAKTESDASLLAGFQAAHAAGLSVVFKAAISPLDGTPTSSMAPTDVSAFFASYEAEIVHLATIAQAGGVETFAIGNEMSSLSGPQYRGYWTDLIAAVRQVYHGELTYAAATDEASKVSFWDELDTIGVNTYPPLTTSSTPTVQDLVNAWNEVPTNPYYAAAFEHKSPVDFLHSLSEQYGKPVLMTEMGYRSIDGTAIQPGSWTINGTPDPAAQADAYKAFFQVWTAEGGSWMQGVELWQWDLNNQYTSTGYSVMGKPAEAVVSQYFHGDGTATGGLAFTQVVNGNGSIVRADYDAAGHLTQFATSYVDGSFDQFTFNASGLETSETIRHADGSRDIYNYGIVGEGYTSQHTLSDSLGHSVAIEDYRADGSLILKQTVDASGIKTVDQYDSLGHTIEVTVTQKDGSYVQSTYAADGSLVTETLAHADGSRDIYSYGIVGKDYSSQHTVDDSSGHSVLIEDYRADGSMLLKQTVESGVVSTLDQYDSAGHVTEETVTQKDGSYVQSIYAADDTLTTETLRHADGSRDIYSYDIVGKDYTSQHTVDDSSGHSVLIEDYRADGSLLLKQTVDASGIKTVDTYDITGQAYTARHDVTDASGHRIMTTFDNNDGSHTMTAYVSGVTLTSTTANDVINSAGGDTFVFNQVSGHDIINNFKSGDAAGHDILQLASSVAVDFAHLAVQVVGHDTVIDLGHDASITLAGVITPLTAHDVLIV
jgi:hypothetical protein